MLYVSICLADRIAHRTAPDIDSFDPAMDTATFPLVTKKPDGLGMHCQHEVRSYTNDVALVLLAEFLEMCLPTTTLASGLELNVPIYLSQDPGPLLPGFHLFAVAAVVAAAPASACLSVFAVSLLYSV